MPHIDLPPGHSPGISGLLMYREDTAKPLRDLVEILLRGPSTLSMAEREIIASTVSWGNDCHFCHTSHGAAACAHLGRDASFIDEIKAGLPNEPLSPKMRALLHVALQVRKGGKHVTPNDVAKAKAAGATDREIHDTVLIAASFCLFNRYVDGLATWAWPEKEKFMEIGGKMAHEGYMEPYVPSET